MEEEAKPKQENARKADYYDTPQRQDAYDLKSARQLTEQPVWVKYGNQLTYYPYDLQRRKTDFGHEAGLLLPLEKLAIRDVVTDVAPQAPGNKQVLACFSLDGKNYAVPIGAEKGSDFKLRADDIFFLEDPHDLYKHCPSHTPKKIDPHEG